MKKQNWGGCGGFSLVEAVVATLILGVIISAAMSLFLSQQKRWIIQEQVSEMQQSVRVSMDDITRNIRMAGCGYFPNELLPLVSEDANPDSILMRQNLNDCHINIGKNTESNTMHTHDDISCFTPGLRAYIWDNTGQREWFTVDRVDTNQGLGWYEIHSDGNLLNDYDKDDNPQVVVMTEVKYYIDNTTDADHPALMRSTNGLTAQVFAENIEDLQVSYLMNDGDTTATPSNLNDVRIIQIELRARTERQDQEWTDQEHDDGFRRRTLVSWVEARNLGI